MSEWQGFYSTAQVSRLARVPLRTLYDWKARKIIKPSVVMKDKDDHLVLDGYSYADLTIIKILRALRQDQIDLSSAGIANLPIYYPWILKKVKKVILEMGDIRYSASC